MYLFLYGAKIQLYFEIPNFRYLFFKKYYSYAS